MSRTKHNSKGPGYEYWSSRPGNNKTRGTIGKWAKRITHKVERRKNKKLE